MKTTSFANDPALHAALLRYVSTFGAHRFGGPGDGVGAYSAAEVDHDTAMAAAWNVWATATPRTGNAREALLRWADRQGLVDAVTAWQTSTTARELRTETTEAPPTSATETPAIGLPSDAAVLDCLREFALTEWGMEAGAIDGRTLDRAWGYFYGKADGSADRAAELAKGWHLESYGMPSPMTQTAAKAPAKARKRV